ncbi:MAG: AAA family ATPase [Candidatus Anstonellales archaeon]
MGTPLKSLRVKSVARMLSQDDNLRNALLIFLGTLMLLSTFPFYPWYLALVVAGIVGAIGYRMPVLGTLSSLVIAIPAAAYQHPLYAWLLGGAFAIAAFEVFELWAILSYLEIIVFLPLLTELPFSFLSGFIYLLLALGSFFVGSVRSRVLVGVGIYFILLLSTLWNINTIYFPLNNSHDLYKVEQELSNNRKDAAEIFEIPIHIIELPAKLFSSDAIDGFNLILGKIFENTLSIFFHDIGFLHIGFYLILFYAISYLPDSQIFVQLGIKKNRQTYAALLLLVIPFYNLIWYLYYGYDTLSFLSVLIYVLISIVIIYYLDIKQINLARDLYVRKKDTAKAFGKSHDELDTSVTSLNDIANYEDVKKELWNAIVLPLESLEISYAYDLRPPKGVLFFGPPGTGKTMMMKALARQLRYNFDYIKASDLLSEWYGESEKNVTRVFEIARKKAPCILFFDEIDTFARRRTAHSTDESTQRVLNTFLQEMDGFRAQKNVIIVGATNVPHLLDPAILRPGRFDKLIYMPLPDYEGRKKIFELYINRLKPEIKPEFVDYDRLAKKSERFSGADIKNVIDECVRLAASDAQSKGEIVKINQEMIEFVLSSVKPSVSLSDLEEYERFRMDFERRISTTGKKVDVDDDTKIKLSDVIGLEGVKQLVREAIEYPLLHEEEMKKYDVKPLKGILLFGPPGCGKTMLVKAAANELNAKFLYASCAEISKNGITYMASAIKDLFTRARENAPSIVFLDEIEAIASTREFGISPSVSQLLTELDGIRELKNVVVIGATNVPEIIDRALLRPGRFDRVILIPPPDIEARKHMFIKFLEKVPQENIDYEKLAQLSEGYSGADINAVCQDIKMELVRRKVKGQEFVINTDIILAALQNRKPSISSSEMAKYLKIYAEFSGDEYLKREVEKREKSSNDEDHSHYR